MTENTAPTAPKSLAERIEAARRNLDRLLVQERTLSIRDAIGAGDNVTFNYGKAPNVRTLSGIVNGVRDVPTGPNGGIARQVSITAGEGFDTKNYVVFVQAILTVGDQDTSLPEGDDFDASEGPLGEE
jgi:hypothetical protein